MERCIRRPITPSTRAISRTSNVRHQETTSARYAAWTSHTLQQPAGGGRSNRNQGGDGTIVTADMRADPKFMLNPRNKELIMAAAKEGRFR